MSHTSVLTVPCIFFTYFVIYTKSTYAAAISVVKSINTLYKIPQSYIVIKSNKRMLWNIFLSIWTSLASENIGENIRINHFNIFNNYWETNVNFIKDINAKALTIHIFDFLWMKKDNFFQSLKILNRIVENTKVCVPSQNFPVQWSLHPLSHVPVDLLQGAWFLHTPWHLTHFPSKTYVPSLHTFKTLFCKLLECKGKRERK